MSLTYLELTNALESYVNDQWANRTPVAWENESFVESNDGWIYVHINHSPSENAGLGTNCVRLHGSISVTIYTRYDRGVGLALSLADQLVEILQNKSINGILTYTTDILKVGDASRQMNRMESGYYMVLMSTRFETS